MSFLLRFAAILTALSISATALAASTMASSVPAPKYPGAVKAAANTVVAPLVGVAENHFAFRYSVKPYLQQVEPARDGRGGVTRSSRPSSLAMPGRSDLVKGRLLARHVDPEALKKGYEVLYARGVRAVVDLRFEGSEAEARSAAEAAHLTYRNVKLKDNAWHNPQPVLIDALNAIETEARAGRTVDVHCQAGIGRTGLVIAAYQAARRGLSEDAAVRYARSSGMQLMGQEHALRKFVRALKEGKITRGPDGTLTATAHEG